MGERGRRVKLVSSAVGANGGPLEAVPTEAIQ
jgi:hypothetical protein